MNLPLSSLPDQEMVPRIEVDSLPYSYISSLQQRFGSKLFNPNLSPDSTENLLAKREEWRDSGAVTVYTTGVYDMMHLDHAGYLAHVKASGAAELYRRENQFTSWSGLTTEQQQDYTSQALSNRALKLVVSVDGDNSVSARKGFQADKGGGPRPVLAWGTRALMVASQTFIDPLDQQFERLLPTTDAVTIHGPEDFTASSFHTSHFSLAELLKPDVWVIYGESVDVLERAPHMKALGNTALRCIQAGPGTTYFEDDFIGKMSTTKIVNRILGTAR